MEFVEQGLNKFFVQTEIMSDEMIPGGRHDIFRHLKNDTNVIQKIHRVLQIWWYKRKPGDSTYKNKPKKEYHVLIRSFVFEKIDFKLWRSAHAPRC